MGRTEAAAIIVGIEAQAPILKRAEAEGDVEASQAKRLKPELAVKNLRIASHVVTPWQEILDGIDLMVCDMAGTTVQEGGIVYKTLRQSMQKHGLQVSEDDMHPWHGAKKEAVIEHFAKQAGLSEVDREEKVRICSKTFTDSIEDAYFSESAPIGPIDAGLKDWFERLRKMGIKVGLDTGYPQSIQKGLVEKLGFEKAIDGYISSYDVPEGRPFPYMIHRLMERMGIQDVRRVAKIGDSVRDVEMGKNAGCGLVVGVLSGADGAEELMAAGADIVCDLITDLPVPSTRKACL